MPRVPRHPPEGCANPRLENYKWEHLQRNFPDRHSRTYMCPKQFPPFNPNDKGKLAEKKVYDVLSQMDEPMVVIYSHEYCVTKMGEADFLICHKNRGIMLFQVKATTTTYEATLRYSKARDQLHKDCETIHKCLEGDLKLTKKNVRYAVAFPNMSSGTFKREGMLNEEHLASKEALQQWLNDYRDPQNQEFSCVDYNNCISYFTGSEMKYLWNGIHDYLNELTPDQAKVLNGLPDKFNISGPAGSGKTEVLIHNASEQQLSQQRVLIIVYNRALANYVIWRLQEIPNVHVMTFRGLLVKITETRYSYEKEIKKVSSPVLVYRAIQILNLSAGIRNTCTYDSIFVDEAQDMEGQWEELINLMHNEGTRHLKRFFFDDNQMVMYSSPPEMFGRNVYHLQEVIRNPKNVFDRSMQFYQSDRECMASHGCHGPVVEWYNEFTDYDLEHFTGPVLNSIHHIIDKMWTELVFVSPMDICILVENGERAKSLREKFEHRQYSNVVPFDCQRMVSYLDNGAWPTDEIPGGKCGVVVDSVSRYKGLGSKAVILLIRTKTIDAKPREKMYVGITRASCKLVVIVSNDGHKDLEEKIGNTIPATTSADEPMDTES